MLKSLLAAALCLLPLAAPAAAAEIDLAGPQGALARMLVDQERTTWVNYGKKDVEALAAVTADDFSDIYADGDVVDRATYLADVKDVTVTSYDLSGFHVFQLGAGSLVVTYYAHAFGTTPRAGKIETEVAVTSAWAMRDGTWKNVFYREDVLALNGKRLLPAPK